MENVVKRTNAIVDVWAEPTLNKDNFLSVEYIKIQRNFGQGLSKVKNTPYYDRVLKEKLSVDYVELKIAGANNGLKNRRGNKEEF